MTVEQFDNFDGRVEYWSRDRGVAFVCRDDGPAHEILGGRLPGLLARVELERGLARNEATISSSTIESLVWVGRILGDRDGTGPMDDAQIAGYMRRSHDVGHKIGFARGLEQGQETAFAFAATETLRLRGIPVSENFDRRVAATKLSPQALLHAAQLSVTEADFWARLGGGQPVTGEM